MRLLAQHTSGTPSTTRLLRSGFWKAALIVTLLRLPPNAPFAATNVTMAALRVPVGPYLLGTLAGLAPRTSAVVVLGAGLSALDFSSPRQAGWFAGGVAVTFIALGVVGWMARRALVDLEARTVASYPSAAEGRRDAGPPGGHRLRRRRASLFGLGGVGGGARSRTGEFWFTASGSATARRAARSERTRRGRAPGTVVLVARRSGVHPQRRRAERRPASCVDGRPGCSAFRLVPRVIRDAVYLALARNRHRLNRRGPVPCPRRPSARARCP